jgi:uncharacterized phage protein (TIGR02216 family)
MAAAFGPLRLAPAVFWSMTIPELSAALRSLTGPDSTLVAFARPDLTSLMQRYPDQ